MDERLFEKDEDMAERAREYVRQQAPRLDERARLVEAFAISLVSGLGEISQTGAESVVCNAEHLADALLRRRAARGGA